VQLGAFGLYPHAVLLTNRPRPPQISDLRPSSSPILFFFFFVSVRYLFSLPSLVPRKLGFELRRPQAVMKQLMKARGTEFQILVPLLPSEFSWQVEAPYPRLFADLLVHNPTLGFKDLPLEGLSKSCKRFLVDVLPQRMECFAYSRPPLMVQLLLRPPVAFLRLRDICRGSGVYSFLSRVIPFVGLALSRGKSAVYQRGSPDRACWREVPQSPTMLTLRLARPRAAAAPFFFFFFFLSPVFCCRFGANRRSFLDFQLGAAGSRHSFGRYVFAVGTDFLSAFFPSERICSF